MSIFKQFQTNESKEQEGVEVTYAPNDDGTVPTFIVARMGGANKEFTRVLTQETLPYRRLIEADKVPPRQAEAINRRVFCRAILKGWKNIQDVEGKTIEYNFENALALMEKLHDLWIDLQLKAQQASLFADDTLESAIKN